MVLRMAMICYESLTLRHVDKSQSREYENSFAFDKAVEQLSIHTQLSHHIADAWA